MMTVAACVIPDEVPAVIASNLVNHPAGVHPVAHEQAISDKDNGNQQGDHQKDSQPGEQIGEADPPTGTTVQLPTLTVTNIVTTVSVPDGGTVLLGGLKRLQEGRTEAAVPLLNKIPSINRPFGNHGIGQESTNLMIMVTPRIIIQEEE